VIGIIVLKKTSLFSQEALDQAHSCQKFNKIGDETDV